MKMYGSLTNRIAEQSKDAQLITVGMGATEFHYSDRDAWEVIEVKDQKHVTVRELDHELDGEPMSNDWRLVSNPDNRTMNLVKRGNYWYVEIVLTAEDVENFDEWDVQNKIWFAMNDFSLETIRDKGKQKRYHRKNIKFGYASYYYDYSF